MVRRSKAQLAGLGGDRATPWPGPWLETDTASHPLLFLYSRRDRQRLVNILVYHVFDWPAGCAQVDKRAMARMTTCGDNVAFGSTPRKIVS